METTDNAETRRDLAATVAARRELGGELDDELIGAFLDRMQTQIDQRVQEQVEARMGKISRRAARKHSEGIEGVMALAIPLLVVAGIFGHLAGIIAVTAGIVVIALLMFVQDNFI